MNKWDWRFLDLAKTVAKWSKDPSSQCGSVIAMDKTVLGLGFNGFPECIEDKEEWLHDRPTKYKLVTHAEENAIRDAVQKGSIHGATIYNYPYTPCPECAKRIAAWGIKRVVAPNNIHSPGANFVFEKAGIETYYLGPAEAVWFNL